MARNLIQLSMCALISLLAGGAAWADGAAYAMTNALGNNEIVVYHRAANGTLTQVQTIATGGGGSGLQLAGVDSLGSAGSLRLDKDHHILFAVNTESAAENNGAGAYNTDCQQGTITSFRVASDGTLTFADRVFSGGLFPNSLTVTKLGHRHDDDSEDRHDDAEWRRGNAEGDILYVLNAGGPEPPATCHLTPDTANTPNVIGFRVDGQGHMIPLDSTQPIDPGPAVAPSGVSCTLAAALGFSALTGAPAFDFLCGFNPPSFARSATQILFSPDGDQLVVSVKGTNTIYVFPVDRDGSLDNAAITQAPGPALPTYFGIAFDKQGHLLVVETFGDATFIPAGGKGAVSSWAVSKAGTLSPISSDVADGGTAPAAIVVEPAQGHFAFVSNNLSAAIAAYTIASNGSVTLLNGIAASGAGPNDLAIAAEEGASFLYVVDAGTGTVGAFQVNLATGVLTPIVGGGGLPTGRSAQGLAAF